MQVRKQELLGGGTPAIPVFASALVAQQDVGPWRLSRRELLHILESHPAVRFLERLDEEEDG